MHFATGNEVYMYTQIWFLFISLFPYTNQVFALDHYLNFFFLLYSIVCCSIKKLSGHCMYSVISTCMLGLDFQFRRG